MDNSTDIAKTIRETFPPRLAEAYQQIGLALSPRNQHEKLIRFAKELIQYLLEVLYADYDRLRSARGPLGEAEDALGVLVVQRHFCSGRGRQVRKM